MILEKEPRLRAACGPADIQLETRVGRTVRVSQGAIAVVEAMEKAGVGTDEYRRAVVLRTAIEVLLRR